MNDKKIKIATHDGKFHTDEVFAVATLLLALGKKVEDDDIEIIRTRDQSLVDKADYVFDVGATYDHSKRRYDHHQEGGAGEDEGIPYSSFGLAWKHYGLEVSEGNNEVVYKIDHTLVKAIDAIDNGVGPRHMEMFPGVRLFDIGNVIDSFRSFDKESDDEQFRLALNLACLILLRTVRRIIQRMENAKIADKLVSETHDKCIVILDQTLHIGQNSFWAKYPDLLFVIYEESAKWYLMTVNEDPNGFKNRKDLPKEWAGKRDEELQKVTGVSD